MKIYKNELGQMTNMVAMPIYGKNLKNLLLQNQQTNDLETWYVASCMKVLPKFLNYDPGLTMTHFTPRSNLVTKTFV